MSRHFSLPYEIDPDTGFFVLGYGQGSSPTFNNVTATGQFLAADGTALLPSYAWTSDPDTGFYRTGNGVVAYSSNGVGAFSMTGGVSGGITFTALGTNQSINLTPSGTANVNVGGLTVDQRLIVNNTNGYNIGVASQTNGVPYYIGATPSASAPALIFSNNGGTTKFKLTDGGNLLLGGLTTDGTGVLQFPAATTSAGGIGFGADTYFFRSATGVMRLSASQDDVEFRLVNNSGNTVRFQMLNGSNAYLQADGGSITFQPNNATALVLNTDQSTTVTKKVSSYNGVSTAGWGVSTVQADGNIAGTTNGRSAAVATYTVGAADGTFVVGGAINVTTSTTFSFSLDVVYTDDSNVSRTLVLPLTQLAGTFVATGLATNVLGAGPYESATMTIRCKTGTTITIRPSAGGTYTAVVYNVAANIRQVG